MENTHIIPTKTLLTASATIDPSKSDAALKFGKDDLEFVQSGRIETA